MNGLSLNRPQRRRLERQLQQTRDARVYRRTLAILEFVRGRPVAQIARTLEVDRRSVYRWVDAYCESLDPLALEDDARSGRPCRWSEECSEWLGGFLTKSPRELGYIEANWTIPLLQECLELCSGKRFSDDTLRRRLRQLGYVWKRTRYVLAPDPEREKKTADSLENQASSAAQRAVGRG